MALTLEQFRERLIHSGIVTREEVSELDDYTEVAEAEDTVQVLARRLVNSGKITKYQAGRVYSGRGAGLILGNYVILDKIGQGGMGRVFKARHRRMKRLVALKELPASMTRSNRALKRFQREVEVAGQLDHPNIVTAFDADETSGSVFLVMEFVDGLRIDAWCDERLLEAGRLDVVTPGLAASEERHGAGRLRHNEMQCGPDAETSNRSTRAVEIEL